MGMNLEGEPILENGVLADPHQLRCVLHELAVLVVATLNNPMIVTQEKLDKLVGMAALAHDLVCEDVAQPEEQSTPQEADPWQLFSES